MKSKSQINKFYLTFLLTIVLLSSVAFGLSFTGETSGQWTKYGFDRYSSNGYVYFTGSFDANVESGVNFTYTDTEVAGIDAQPIAFDWDSDGTVEIIVAQGTTLKVYNPSTNNLVEEASYNMGGTMATQGWCGTDTTLGKYCVFNMGSYIVTLSYDGTTVSSLASSSLRSVTMGSAINCHSDSDDSNYTIPYCFFIGDNVSESRTYLAQYRADTDDDLSYTSGGANYQELVKTKNIKPIISDIDYDGILEIVWTTRATSIYLLYEEWNYTNNVITNQNSVAYSGAVDDFFGSISAYDLDGATDEEICISYTDSTATRLKCYNSDMTTYDTLSLGGTGDASIGHLHGDVDGDGVQEIVLVYRYDPNLRVASYESNGGSLVLNQLFLGETPADDTLVPTLAKANSDSYFDLIYGDTVFYYNSTGEVYLNETKNFVASQHIVPVNFNQDAIMDFVGQKANSLSIYSTGIGGLPTTSTISLNSDLDNSGFYNYYSTVCLDSVAQYKALECVTGVFDSTCTYINTDTTANERIYTDCGGLGVVTGSYSALNPNVNCTWDTVGTYNLNLYMQDPATSSYYGIYDTIPITVVDGTTGIDCNIPTQLITAPSSQSSTSTPTTVTGIGDFFTIFSGGSSVIKFIFGIVIILGMMVMAFEGFKSVFMAIMFGIAGLILTTILGLIPLWVVIGLALMMALPLLLKLAFGNS